MAVREHQDRSVGKQPLQDQESREEVRRSVQGAALILPDSPIREPKITDNVLILAEGTHGGAVLTKPYTRLVGAADTRITRLVTLETTAVVQGVYFRSVTGDKQKNNAAYLTLVKAAAKVIFQGCIFEKNNLDSGSFVEIEAGGKAEFIGCIFRGGGNATSAVNNAGLAGDVHIIGSLRTTAAAHVNVTVLAEI